VDEAQARQHLRHLAVLGGGVQVRRRAAAALLGTLSEPEAVGLLSAAILLGRARWDPAVVALPALLEALDVDRERVPHAETLQRVASLSGTPEVEQLFAEGPPALELDANAAARADARLVSLPLGVLKSRARLTRNPDELARRAVVSHPAVIREVLKNPRLTEPLVVRIAARRPARPEPLAEIWRSPRWSVRPAVRRALAFNPYLPLEVASKLLPLLARGDLEELQRGLSVHPALREQAAQLLEGRATP
jgi:hypothetical protein